MFSGWTMLPCLLELATVLTAWVVLLGLATLPCPLAGTLASLLPVALGPLFEYFDAWELSLSIFVGTSLPELPIFA